MGELGAWITMFVSPPCYGREILLKVWKTGLPSPSLCNAKNNKLCKVCGKQDILFLGQSCLEAAENAVDSRGRVSSQTFGEYCSPIQLQKGSGWECRGTRRLARSHSQFPEHIPAQGRSRQKIFKAFPPASSSSSSSSFQVKHPAHPPGLQYGYNWLPSLGLSRVLCFCLLLYPWTNKMSVVFVGFLSYLLSKDLRAGNNI